MKIYITDYGSFFLKKKKNTWAGGCGSCRALQLREGLRREPRPAGTWRAPRTKVSSAVRAPKKQPRRSARLSAKSAPAKVETKPKKAAGRNLQTIKSNKRGKGGTAGKQAEVANQETKRK